MGTVLEYLKEYGDYTLEEMPFSEVDSLILSQFSYLKFDEMLPGAEGAQAAGTEEQTEGREAGAEAERTQGKRFPCRNRCAPGSGAAVIWHMEEGMTLSTRCSLALIRFSGLPAG